MPILFDKTARGGRYVVFRHASGKVQVLRFPRDASPPRVEMEFEGKDAASRATEYAFQTTTARQVLAEAAVCAGRETVNLTPSQEKKLFGGKPVEHIGTGTRACAYGVGRDDVVKFTLHDRDAAAALAVMKRPVPGVLRVTGVAPVTDYHFVIKSKRVPVPGPVARLVQRCAAEGHLDRAFVERAQSEQRPPARVPSAVEECILVRGPSAGVAPAKGVAFVRELAKTQAKLSNATGVHWFDVFHPGNFSQDEKGRPVIIDLGATLVPKRYVDALKRRSTLRGAGRPPRAWHILAEGAALVLGVPIMLSAAQRLSGRARTALVGAAIATTAIDVWFIARQS